MPSQLLAGFPAPSFGLTGRAALIVAHPAHELLVHAWLEEARPRAHILTDGGGRAGASRLDGTTRILDAVGAQPGLVYAPLTERGLYAAIMGHDVSTFVDLTRDLADALVDDEIDYVVGDSWEGAIVGHDVCRLLIGAAVEIASHRRRRPIGSFAFLNQGPRAACGARRCPEAIQARLGRDAFERKLTAGRRYVAIAAEMEEMIGRHGLEAFRTECLHAVAPSNGFVDRFEHAPEYERHGEALVAAGIYPDVLRYHTHIVPLAAALQSYVEGDLDGRAAHSHHEQLAAISGRD